MKKRNEENENYGKQWGAGDTVGCYLDLDNTCISYSLNGVDMGVAFDDLLVQDWTIYPAFTVAKHQSCTINLGETPFKFK